MSNLLPQALHLTYRVTPQQAQFALARKRIRGPSSHRGRARYSLSWG